MPPDRPRSAGRETVRILLDTLGQVCVIGALAASLLATTAVAQEDMASNVCSTAEYNLLVGLLMVVIGLAITMIVAAAALGSAGKALGGFSRSLSQAGSAGMIYSVVAFLGFMLIVAIMGIAFGNLSIPVPSECLIPF